MYLAAGQIMPAVTGKNWDDFVRERIFMPLGMNDHQHQHQRFQVRNHVATPHCQIDDKFTPIPCRNIDNIAPAGSINSNVVDMAQWVRLHLGVGTFRANNCSAPAL